MNGQGVDLSEPVDREAERTGAATVSVDMPNHMRCANARFENGVNQPEAIRCPRLQCQPFVSMTCKYDPRSLTPVCNSDDLAYFSAIHLIARECDRSPIRCHCEAVD